MNNTAVNTIKYTGIVTLSQYNGKTKTQIAQVSNTGGNKLFEFITDCLIGDFDIAKQNRPTKLKLLYRTPDEDNLKSYKYTSSSHFIFLMNKPEKVYSENGGKVRYSFMLSRDLLAGNKFNCIGLYADSARERDSDIEAFAALCEVSEELNSASLSSSSVLVVDWELIISNK